MDLNLASPSAAVVGAGVFGASIADALARRGWDVTIVEQAAPAHPLSSSGDATRVYRCGHGEDLADAWHTRSARAARAGWKELEEEAGRPLLIESGVAWFDCGGDPWVAEAERNMRDCGIPVQRMPAGDAAGLFPSLATEGLDSVLFEPEAGALRASDAVQALVRRAQRHGARLVLERAAPRDGRAQLRDGRVIGADRTVWACGPWLGGLFGGDAPIRPTRQDLFYWRAPPGWEAERVPAWVEMATRAYGIGSMDGGGFKAVVEELGEEHDPHAGDRVSSAAVEARTREALARRFPALAGVALQSRKVMLYESTPDRCFILGHLPGDEAVWLAGGGSGHGFKHGPTVGQHVADCLEGLAEPDPRFAPGPRTAARPGGALGPPR